ncbi:MAG: DUF192 domain-containing protein [Treponema sp.]|jgi:uncharacterized membrane protein (UPF0127 family)|nr:DUF192 domain-containing protein [Treponema sp.]
MRTKVTGPLAAFLAAALSLSCAEQTLKIKTIIIETNEKQTPLEVEVAETPEERQKGLMFRKSLADGKGMLFIFEQDQVLGFWMKNTLIPLSIAFIAGDGTILEIRDMEPQSLRPVQSRRSARYALEVPQGWFTRADIHPGARVRIADAPLP